MLTATQELAVAGILTVAATALLIATAVLIARDTVRRRGRHAAGSAPPTPPPPPPATGSAPDPGMRRLSPDLRERLGDAEPVLVRPYVTRHYRLGATR